MFHLYVAEMEAQVRRDDARREALRLKRIQQAMSNGTYERSGWLTSLARRLSGLPARVYRRRQQVVVSPARATPC